MSGLPAILITVFGLGRMRPAPGTWGSLPPFILAAALVLAGFTPRGDGLALYHALMALVLLVFGSACVLWGGSAEVMFGRKDPSQVVADESAGMALPLAALPIGDDAGPLRSLAFLAVAFVLFRAADILKPPPARGLQRVDAGWGILLDDLAAGLYAAVLLQPLALIPSGLLSA
jgi:phosphatidylglycerophosphatase A